MNLSKLIQDEIFFKKYDELLDYINDKYSDKKYTFNGKVKLHEKIRKYVTEYLRKYNRNNIKYIDYRISFGSKPLVKNIYIIPSNLYSALNIKFGIFIDYHYFKSMINKFKPTEFKFTNIYVYKNELGEFFDGHLSGNNGLVFDYTLNYDLYIGVEKIYDVLSEKGYIL